MGSACVVTLYKDKNCEKKSNIGDIYADTGKKCDEIGGRKKSVRSYEVVCL